MTDIFHNTFWNYNRFEDYKPEMLEDWINLGITTPILPTFDMNRHSKEALISILDDVQSKGIQCILQVSQMYLEGYARGAESYRADVSRVMEEFGSHPAVYGFYVGEEPNCNNEECYFEGTKIIKELAPDKCVYSNFGSIERTERMMLKGKSTIEEWVSRYKEYSNADTIGFGVYSQLFSDHSGVYEFFHNMRTFVEAGKKAGVGVWGTMLSSAHDLYRVPSEDDFRWQINMCAVCGCKGVVWFRLYDKLVAFDYRSSPIDEFGEKTQRYYDLARVQKRFNIHYGKLLGRLQHISTYGIGVSFGGYPYFVPGIDKTFSADDIVVSADCRSAMISFFKDEDGTDYVAVANSSMTEAHHISLSFSDKVEKAELVYHNGDVKITSFERGDLVGAGKSGYMCLAPGQMEILKITLK